MNREIVLPSGAGIYPLIGDVQSQAGNAQVRVIGLQGTPVLNTFFQGGEVLEYNPNAGQWQPILRASIQCNSLTISDDYTIMINVNKPVLVNGV